MIINHESTAPTIEVTGQFARKLTVLLSPALNPELTSLAAGLSILPPASKSDGHLHSEGEMFYVVSGKGQISVGDEQEDVLPGSAVWGPPHVYHQIINNGKDTLRVLWVLCPPGREVDIIKKSYEQNK
ncbi:MAG: hypothetical protein A2Y13_07775 [Planctomycetes bacterium GWC2_45_44]|nr:MAG: hypothetical protein A2Y13_07775 [Planctomycetes bacterium GWC2_45_44]